MADSSACCWDTVPAGAAGALVAGSLVAGAAGAEDAGAGLVAGAAGALVAGWAGAGLAAGWLPPDAPAAMPPIRPRASTASPTRRTV